MNKALLVFGLAVLPFATGPSAVPHALASRLDGTSWVLATLGGRTLTGHSRITLAFEQGRVRGTDGCNQYSGPYSAAETRLEIGPEVMSTQMGCPAEIMRWASTYMSVLLGAKAYRINNGELLLVGATGAVVAIFVTPTKPSSSP